MWSYILILSKNKSSCNKSCNSIVPVLLTINISILVLASWNPVLKMIIDHLNHAKYETKEEKIIFMDCLTRKENEP